MTLGQPAPVGRSMQGPVRRRDTNQVKAEIVGFFFDETG
jgi:hypothetical protein